MKKFSYLLLMLMLPAFILTGCSSDDNNNSQIELPNPAEQTQEAYADNAATGGFTFTARSAWTATVSEATPAGRLAVSDPGASVSTPSWLRLLYSGEEKYSGEAGQFRLAIELDYNYSGETRSATITITSGSDKITITVTQEGKTESGDVPDDRDVMSVSLNKTTLILERNASEYLIATVRPATAINKNVTWTSSNEDVAYVSSEGQVIAESVGTAEITVTTEDGEKTAKCTVTVIELQPTGAGVFTLKYDDGSGTAILNATRVIVDTLYHIVDMGSGLYFNYMTNSGKLEAGTYTWGGSSSSSSSLGWNCQKVSADDVFLYFEEGIADQGTVKVSISGGTYTITLDWKGTEGGGGFGRPGTLKGTYTGKVIIE